ncbi:FIST signal transduction protein [Haloarcula sebkhae]|uniref:FIST signal transduction protein n=1 Tax=Haloarcula sebkhae TaxID=932660 RepID=A0ACC6VK96_9EURY|nr:FIST N-terminal domain-containing protein [Haloarcula sebkhae]
MSPHSDASTAVATGTSVATAGTRAGREATSAARDRLDADRVDFCQVFASSGFDAETVLAGVNALVDDETAVVGCTAGGAFTEEQSMDTGVAVTLVTSDSFRFDTALAVGLSENTRGAVRDAVRALPEDIEEPYQSAIVLHDGLSGVGEQLSLSVQRRLGPYVEFAGGAASDGLRMESAPVFCDESVAEDAVVLVLVSGEKRPIITVNHGHSPISEPWEVTDVSGNVVHELNGEPAFDVWKDAVRDHAMETSGIAVDDVPVGSADLRRLMVTYLFGIDQGETFKIRWPRTAIEETGALQFAVDIPEGTVLRIMHGNRADQIASAEQAAADAVSLCDGNIAGAFVYDCACRQLLFDDAFSAAVDGIISTLSAPVAGFETYGELCMQAGQLSGFHNTTTVLFALPE